MRERQPRFLDRNNGPKSKELPNSFLDIYRITDIPMSIKLESREDPNLYARFYLIKTEL